ncbi:MAG: hypothetical protein AAF497_24555 [Planctomycetota bacterium]
MPKSGCYGLLFLALLAFIVGCGNSDMAQVTGQVTLDGQPVTEVFVVFQPQAEGDSNVAKTRSAMAEVDAEGKYVLSTNKQGDGALVGKHKVMLTPVNRNAQLPGRLAPNYMVTVEPGENTIDLKLEK